MLIGSQTAEEVKMAIGCVNPRPEALVMTVKGRNLSTGLPQEVDITSVDVMHALTTPCRDILYAVRSTLEKTEPELVADISRSGLRLLAAAACSMALTNSSTVPPALPAMWRTTLFYAWPWAAVRASGGLMRCRRAPSTWPAGS